MPQLDLIVYYPQFLWFSLGFSVFYLIVLYKIIPTIAFSLKFRKKKSLYINNFTDLKKNYNLKEFLVYYDFINNILQISRLYIIKINSQVIFQIGISLKKIDLFFFKNNNNILIKKLMYFYLSGVKAKLFLI